MRMSLAQGEGCNLGADTISVNAAVAGQVDAKRLPRCPRFRGDLRFGAPENLVSMPEHASAAVCPPAKTIIVLPYHQVFRQSCAPPLREPTSCVRRNLPRQS